MLGHLFYSKKHFQQIVIFSFYDYPYYHLHDNFNDMKIITKSIVLTGLLVSAAVSPAFAFKAAKSKHGEINLKVLGTYRTGIFDDSAAEINAYDPRSKRVFVTNAEENTLDVINIRRPWAPQKVLTIDLEPYGAGPNSVAVKNGIVAVAVENEVKQDPGQVVFFDAYGKFLNKVTVGALPDMLTFCDHGEKVLVANEGEPDDDYIVDPEGSISVIELPANIYLLNQSHVSNINFQAFNAPASIDPKIRIFGPNASVAQDLEPEYITVDAACNKAYVAMQENNAMAIIDIQAKTVVDLIGLGFKNHNVIQNALDASNRDDAIRIKKWPVYGMYQPDALASYQYQGNTYIVSADEGDARDYDGFSEEDRVKDLTLNTERFPNAAELQDDENLGRLKITTVNGIKQMEGDAVEDGEPEYEKLFSFGGRSFSIWDENVNLIYNSGSDFERITADVLPDDFNSTNDENESFDNRSDDKGPEPEALALGEIYGETYAFIGLERVGGIMVYNITNPVSPYFVQYINNRDFSGYPEADTAGDLGPEGISFISAEQSPINMPLLVVSNEVSGSTTVYKISKAVGFLNYLFSRF